MPVNFLCKCACVHAALPLLALLWNATSSQCTNWNASIMNMAALNIANITALYHQTRHAKHCH